MARRVHHLLCNGAEFAVPRNAKRLRLDYQGGKQPNVRIELPKFVDQLLHIPARLLDLLESPPTFIALIAGVIVAVSQL